MRKLRFGVLGTGRIVGKGGTAIHRSANTEWIGIAGRTPENGRKAAAEFGVLRSYDGYADLIADPDIDAVYIALLNHLHAEWAIRALEAGKHVLLEKPFALTMEEARAIADAARHNGRQVQEAHVWRHQDAFKGAKAWIEEGRIGDVCEFRGHFSFNADPSSSRLVKEWGGGALYDLGCYLVAWSRYLLDGEPEEIDARAVYDKNGLDRRFAATLYYPLGRVAFISCSVDMALGSSYEILGTKGKLSASYRLSASEAAITIRCGEEEKVWATDRVEPYARQVEAFAAAVLAGEPDPHGTDDALQQCAILDACRESDRLRTRIRLTTAT